MQFIMLLIGSMEIEPFLFASLQINVGILKIRRGESERGK